MDKRPSVLFPSLGMDRGNRPHGLLWMEAAVDSLVGGSLRSQNVLIRNDSAAPRRVFIWRAVVNWWARLGARKKLCGGISSRPHDRDDSPLAAFACCAAGARTKVLACPAGLYEWEHTVGSGVSALIVQPVARTEAERAFLGTFWVLTGTCPYRRSGRACELARHTKFLTLVVARR